MGNEDIMPRDEIISIENSVLSYLHNACLHFEQGDYQRALSFLDVAKNEIEYLAQHNAAHPLKQEPA